MLSPTGSRRFRVATIRLVCIEYRSPFLFIFFLSWSETIPWGKGKHQNTRNARKNWFNVSCYVPPYADLDSLHTPSIHLSIPLTSYTWCQWWGRTCCWSHSGPQSSALLAWSSRDENTHYLSFHCYIVMSWTHCLGWMSCSLFQQQVKADTVSSVAYTHFQQWCVI